MGEARRRGTREERVRQAIARKNAEKFHALGVPMKIACHITQAPSSPPPKPSPRRQAKQKELSFGAKLLRAIFSPFVGLYRSRSS